MRRGQLIIFLICWFFSGAVFFSGAAHADNQYALAMRGAPALPKDFQSFPYADANAPKGGELRVAEIGTFDSLVPWLIKGTAPPELDNWVYDRLMARSWDEPFTLYPLIAESVDASPDKKTLTFHLDPRAKFQDGKPILTEDIQFSWEFLRDHGRPNTRRMFKTVAGVTVVDARTITFHFKPDADAEAPMIVAMMTVLPKHYWQPMGDTAQNTTLTPPVASGPYKISKVEAGHTLILTRDKNYWAADIPSRRGQFNFDSMRIDFYRDEGIAVQAFKAGAFDFRRETNPKRWAIDYNVSGIKKENWVSGTPAPFRALVFNTRRDVFKDIRVRHALQLAFDFEWLNKNLFSGAYARTTSIYPKSALAASISSPPLAGERSREAAERGHNEATPSPNLSPASGGEESPERINLRRAVALLKDAGWEVKDGKLQNAAGKDFAFEILLNDPADEKIALHYVRALSKLGISPIIRTIDSAQFTGRLEQFDFDMTVAQWVSTLSPGSEQAVYWGARAAASPGSRNYAGITDPNVDADITALNTAKTNTDLQTAAHALDRQIMAGCYFIPLYYAPADWVAYWPGHISPPQKLSFYGTALEAWHAAP